MGKFDELLQDFKAFFDERNIKNIVADYNAQFEGDDELLVVFQTIGGTKDGGELEVLPFMLTLWFDESDEKIHNALNEFVEKYNNSHKMLGLNNYKFFVTMPIPQSSHDVDSTIFKNSYIISGTLVITRNLCDIEEILIENQKIHFTDGLINYVTNPSSTKSTKHKINRDKVQSSGLTLQLTTYNRVNIISNIMRKLRTEKISSNTHINVKLKFSDGFIEEYITYANSFTLSFDRQNPSKLSIVLGLFYA